MTDGHRWYVGIDGQVCVDDQYVWLIRADEPTRSAVVPIERRPRRVLLAEVDDVLSGDHATGAGWVHIAVRGTTRDGETEHGSAASCRDCVAYAATEQRDFEQLVQRFRAVGSAPSSPEIVQSVSDVAPIAEADGPEPLLLALDQLGGIATLDELRERVGELARPRAKHWGFIWRSFGDLSIAIGGSGTSSKFRWSREFHDLARRVVAVGPNPTVPKIRRSLQNSSLTRFDFARLAAVWEVMAENIPRDSALSEVSPDVEPSAAEHQTSAAEDPGAPQQTDHSSQREDDGPGENALRPPTAAASPEQPSPTATRPASLRSGDLRRRVTLPLRDRENQSAEPAWRRQPTIPTSDSRLRVVMECEGHFTRGLYDSKTGELQLVSGPVSRKQPYSSPTAAAQAVLSHFSLADTETADGLVLWTQMNGQPIPVPGS